MFLKTHILREFIGWNVMPRWRETAELTVTHAPMVTSDGYQYNNNEAKCIIREG